MRVHAGVVDDETRVVWNAPQTPVDVLQVLDVGWSVENGEFIVTIRALGIKRAGAEVEVQDVSVATDQLIGTAATMGIEVEDHRWKHEPAHRGDAPAPLPLVEVQMPVGKRGHRI